MPEHGHSNFSDYDDFDKFEIYADDGHFNGASAHGNPILGKKQPCGHFYALNLRIHAMTHLSASDA